MQYYLFSSYYLFHLNFYNIRIIFPLNMSEMWGRGRATTNTYNQNTNMGHSRRNLFQSSSTSVPETSTNIFGRSQTMGGGIFGQTSGFRPTSNTPPSTGMGNGITRTGNLWSEGRSGSTTSTGFQSSSRIFGSGTTPPIFGTSSATSIYIYIYIYISMNIIGRHPTSSSGFGVSGFSRSMTSQTMTGLSTHIYIYIYIYICI